MYVSHPLFRLYSANSKTYVGSGKVQDIMAAVNATGTYVREYIKEKTRK